MALKDKNTDPSPIRPPDVPEAGPTPLTDLEALLKKCYLQRPDMQGRIFTGEEMAQYIGWMIERFSDDPAYQFTDKTLPVPAAGTMMEMGTRLLRNPRDKAAFRHISSGYTDQREGYYIVPGRDISVGRMLRYIPAHWHSNDYFEIYYALSGDCPIHFPNEVIHVRPGTVLITAPLILHANPCYEDDQYLLQFLVRASTFEQVFWNQLPEQSLMSSFFRRALSGVQPNSYLQFETQKDPEIRELFQRIYDEYLHGENYGSQMMNALMTTLFILLLRRYEGTAKLPRSSDFYWKQEFSAILNHIETHYAEVSLPQLAARYHYSERQITRIVQRCTGKSYKELVLGLKMESAGRALRGTVLPIERISALNGYANLSSFYRSFHKYYGCSPAEYRDGVE